MLTIRKSTFQLSEEVLKHLGRYHLQLELGKADTPYKEVIVEEVNAQFIANADQKFVDEILKRQKTSRPSSVNQLVLFLSLTRVYWADKPFILPVK